MTNSRYIKLLLPLILIIGAFFLGVTYESSRISSEEAATVLSLHTTKIRPKYFKTKNKTSEGRPGIFVAPQPTDLRGGRLLAIIEDANEAEPHILLQIQERSGPEGNGTKIKVAEGPAGFYEYGSFDEEPKEITDAREKRIYHESLVKSLRNHNEVSAQAIEEIRKSNNGKIPTSKIMADQHTFVTAIREAQEESGIDFRYVIKEYKARPILMNITEYDHIVVSTYALPIKCRGCLKDPRFLPNITEPEILHAQWVPLSKIREKKNNSYEVFIGNAWHPIKEGIDNWPIHIQRIVTHYQKNMTLSHFDVTTNYPELIL